MFNVSNAFHHAIARLVAVLRILGSRGATAADAGMSTAEYAVGMVAACSFAAVLYKILTSSAMMQLLQNLISRALHVAF